jgi:hypothetical protein
MIVEQARALGLDEEQGVLALGGAGVAAMCLSWPLHSRLLRLLGVLAMFGAGALYARGRMTERSERIEEAEAQVHDALDGLDPVARAQVLTDLAK